MAQASSKRVSATGEFGASHFFWRVGASLVLVAATYNPSGYSYFHWVRSAMAGGTLGSEHFVAGVVVAIGWAILGVATQRSLGTAGLLLAAALLGGIVWFFTDIGLLSVGSMNVLAWVIVVCIALLLAIGLSWSHIWRRMTGQLEVDDQG